MAITIDFQPGVTKDETKVTAHGFVQRVPSEAELKMLGWNQQRWNQVIGNNYTGPAFQALDGRPTPTGNIQVAGKASDWDAVKVARVWFADGYVHADIEKRAAQQPTVYIQALPGDGVIQSLNVTPSLIGHEPMDNRGSNIVGHFSESVTGSVDESTSSEWSRSETQSIEVGVTVSVGPDVASAEASTTIGYSVEEGESHTVERTTSFGSESSIEADVPPGQLYAAVLIVATGDMTIQVPVQAHILGDVIIHAPDGRRVAVPIAGAGVDRKVTNYLRQHVTMVADTEAKLVGPLPNDDISTIEHAALDPSVLPSAWQHSRVG